MDTTAATLMDNGRRDLPLDTTAFEALCDPRRLAIVELLADGERCVCDVSEALGISGALASHHLKRLREVGVVQTRRKGAWLHCSLETGTLLSLSEDLRELATRRAATSQDACCELTREVAR